MTQLVLPWVIGAFAIAILGALTPWSRVSADDTRCAALFEQAAAQLAAPT